MSYNYKDLTYIRAAMQSYQGSLETELKENENLDDNEITEMENDLLYVGRLIALIQRDIKEAEGDESHLSIVKNKE